MQLLSGGCGEEEITALTYDSRKAQTGSLFFCLRGARSNGEDFAPAAYAQGCRCFVSEGTLDVPEDADVVRVSDARQALAQISAAFFGFPQRDVTIIGVTGTKGKTTVWAWPAASSAPTGPPTPGSTWEPAIPHRRATS